MPAKQKYTGYQLSYCRTLLKGFLILLEPKIFVPDMTPEPSLSITTHAKLQKILQCFTDVDITAYTFLTLLLNEPTYNDHPCTKDLLGNSSNLFATFLKHPKSSDKTWAWASNLIKRKYSQDIRDLADIYVMDILLSG